MHLASCAECTSSCEKKKKQRPKTEKKSASRKVSKLTSTHCVGLSRRKEVD